MSRTFHQLTFTPSVLRAQERAYGHARPVPSAPERAPLGPEETDFIAARDSFYLASVSETGWPYVQHRGGLPGFLRVLDASTLAFADYRGNRQLLTTGNVSADDRVALFLMDYRQRARLKILGHARVVPAADDAALVERVTTETERPLVERVFVVDVVAFDWNCSKYITPRYRADEVRDAVAAMQARIAELEAQVAALSRR
jgi:predicted pyridoxine 5'-phosphate oxidase superfamily flavin-nucleotide-binding protein